jgi:hypothetical protein
VAVHDATRFRYLISILSEESDKIKIDLIYLSIYLSEECHYPAVYHPNCPGLFSSLRSGRRYMLLSSTERGGGQRDNLLYDPWGRACLGQTLHSCVQKIECKVWP